MRKNLSKMLSIFLCITTVIVYSVPALAATENSDSQAQVNQEQKTEQESANSKSDADDDDTADASKDDTKTDVSGSEGTDSTDGTATEGTDTTDQTEGTDETEDTWPKTGEAGENATWSLAEDGTMTISGTGDMTDYENSTAMPWNDYKDQITSVIIEKGITKIGQNAFSGCTNLASLEISSDGDSLVINKNAFYKCTSLSSVDLPKRVSKLETASFGECGKLEITMRNDNIELKRVYSSESSELINFFENSNLLIKCNSKSKAFYYAAQANIWVTTYGWGGSIDWECITHNWQTEYTIDKEATPFAAGSKSIHCSNYECKKKKDVQTIDQLKSDGGTIGTLTWTINDEGELDITGDGEMPDYTQSGSSVPPWNKYKENITEVYVASEVTNVGAYAFANCKNLKKINANVQKIGEGAFYNCDSLTVTSILATVTEIDTLAYAGCDNLTKVKFPKAEDAPDIDIQENAFKDSSQIEFACNPNRSASTYADKYSITWRCYTHDWETNDDGSD